MECNLGSTMIVNEFCPTQLSQFVLVDAFGTSVSRVVNLNLSSWATTLHSIKKNSHVNINKKKNITHVNMYFSTH
jgi:hypothetical protein